MSIIAVKYVYDDSKADVIAENRPLHRAHLRELYEAGRLLASGPLGSNGALLVVRADGPEDGLGALAGDPFLRLGVIENRTARVWKPVIGPWQ
jgi:putative YCII-related domain protein